MAVPEAGMDDVGIAREQRGDLGAVLAGEQLRHLRSGRLHRGLERLDGGFEVVPRVLAPGVVLVDAGDLLQARLQLDHVERRAYAVHRRVRVGAKLVLVALVIEDPRRPAVEKNRELLRYLADVSVSA